MKIVDILKQKHTVLMSMDGYTEHQGLYDYTQRNVTMNDILFGLGNKFKEIVEAIRKTEYHSDEYNYIKDNNLPVWFVGGTFPMMKTEDEDIVTYSNILSIDIDNQDIDRKAIFDLPFVIAVLRSVGGRGYYVLILVEDGRYTKDYYAYLSKLFMKKYNITVDTQCTNIGRKRVLSYEDNICEWIKPIDYDVKPWKLKWEDYKLQDVKYTQNMLINYKPVDTVKSNKEFASKAIWYLLNKGYSVDNYKGKNKYGAWYHTACEFKIFDDGYDMFEKFSSNSTKYNDKSEDIRKKFNSANTDNIKEEDVYRKWIGIAKNTYGRFWYKK